MLCIYCGGKDTVAERKVRFGICEVPKPFIIENLPVDVCRVCGPTGFSSKTMEGMEKISQGKASPVGTQAVRVFDFNNPRGKQEKVSELSAISKVVGE